MQTMKVHCILCINLKFTWQLWSFGVFKKDFLFGWYFITYFKDHTCTWPEGYSHTSDSQSWRFKGNSLSDSAGIQRWFNNSKQDMNHPNFWIVKSPPEVIRHPESRFIQTIHPITPTISNWPKLAVSLMCKLDYHSNLVMCRARLSSKAQAWAQLRRAQAFWGHEPSLSPLPGLGSGLARAQAWAQ